MSADELRSQYMWRPDIIPPLCVVLFLVVAMLVMASSDIREHRVTLPHGQHLDALRR